MEDRRTTRIAWTESDGFGRAPAGPDRLISIALAGVLLAVFSGMMFTDALCPEHRAWVQGLAVVAMTATVVSAVGLLRRWATAGVWALAAAMCGVGIGVLDAAHSTARGRLIAGAFLIACLGAAVLTLQQLRLHRWAVGVERQLEPPAASTSEPSHERLHETQRDHAAEAPAHAGNVASTPG